MFHEHFTGSEQLAASLTTFFYHSRLLPEQDFSAVGAIIRTARRFNAVHGITGVLVFDGERFCQFIEGPTDAINNLIERLYADTRHIGLTRLVSEACVDERRFPNWSMAFATIDGARYMDELLGRAGSEVLRHLQDTIDTLDIG